ncbi:MAG TPA: helix-turn-helix transcriptional regulator [Pyrinomonadaceae bacterium]|nr:helix-turn-helix transcriptional regulator [Pyrinomonadaceae bacterium]
MTQTTFQIAAVDCCEHVLAAVSEGLPSRFTTITASDNARIGEADNKVDLIVIGLARYPVRRLFISQLRRIYPDVPVLIIRRAAEGSGESVCGEFILSDRAGQADLEIVSALRPVLPFRPCAHAHKASSYDLVRRVVRVIAEKYPDPELNLAQVAGELPISPIYLSRVLNRKVGISFRQLLRHTRIEEAKRMLASRHYSVKEVAERVGFSDCHYFSRSFKELTGQSASEFRAQDTIFG